MRSYAKTYAQEIAIEFFGKKITYDQLFSKIEEVAKSLKMAGVKQGEIVSVCLPNIPEAIYTLYAINRIGAIANMLDVRCAERVLAASVLEAHSNVLITLDSVSDKFSSLKKNNDVKIIVSVSAIESLNPILKKLIRLKNKNLRLSCPDGFMTWKYFLSLGDNNTEELDAKFVKDADAIIAYTGGTTGEPKGVIGTNETVNSVVEMELKVGFNGAVRDSILVIAPPWTYYGICNSINVPLCMGLKLLLVPKVGADELPDLTLKLKPNHIVSVPSALLAFLDNQAMQKADLSFLKSFILGADKLDESLEKEFNLFLSKHNCNIKLSKGYGMTEVMAAAAYSKANANDLGSVGIPYPGNIISTFKDDKDYTECRIREVGEIAICGPTLMKGYFGNAKTQDSEIIKVHKDGTKWIHTGDLGHVGEDGRIYIDGRLKRMFVRNGYKVFPASIENCIMKCDEVQQTAVIAVKDENYGNITKAFVVLKNNADSDSVKKELVKNIADELYDYEYPDNYEFVDKLPLTGMGKIDYKKLENMAKTI
ncbi:class I adenylate-forming enzyme family protein [Butyrivibrio sp. AE3006]|uniref:class I adenylate-forming enzyme family protein n=1 Tax=Butyrivibrio sp. AE3006 TaxID=1280673 RepID=UPI00042A6F52|nr:class I adenylate-forming enzyme family protein [Butyrivibrio sp. AE3006]